MKCPNCGQWNRDTLTKCFKCGCELSGEKNAQKSWKGFVENSGPGKVYVQINEDGTSSSLTDEKETIAREMRDLQARKERGEAEQQKLRVAGAEQGFTPSAVPLRGVNIRENPFSNLENLGENGKGNSNGQERIHPERQRVINYDDYENTAALGLVSAQNAKKYSRRVSAGTRHSNAWRILLKIVILCSIAAVLGCVYLFVVNPILEKMKADEMESEEVIITASIVDDMSAHTIEIPAPDGTVIWIGGDIRKNYEVVGGYATVEIQDSVWYEAEEGVTDQFVDVTLEPYLRTKSGEMKRMKPINYTVEVPLSPLQLIQPDSTYITVNNDTYNLRIKVDKKSSVFVNGEDKSGFINSLEDGTVNLPLTIQPIGDNKFTIVTRCRYYRENEMTVTIHREPVSIEVHLDTTLNDRSIQKTMTIRGTTLAGADLVVLSPYQNLNLSEMSSVGAFSFEAVFETIGNNDIMIQVSMDGIEPTIYTKSVYYMPGANEYSRTAWSMNKQYDYSDYLNNTDLRVRKTQVYRCRGKLIEIISDSPQLAIMELYGTADANGENPRKVLLENQSTDTWKVGQYLTIYGDAYGTYDGMPRLTARYTYKFNPDTAK